MEFVDNAVYWETEHRSCERKPSLLELRESDDYFTVITITISSSSFSSTMDIKRVVCVLLLSCCIVPSDIWS